MPRTADHADRLASLPTSLRLILERLPSPASHALAVELATLQGLHNAPDSVLFDARGAVRGHGHSAWMRGELSRTEYEALMVYAAGLPTQDAERNRPV